jgi:hypothetical protein
MRADGSYPKTVNGASICRERRDEIWSMFQHTRLSSTAIAKRIGVESWSINSERNMFEDHARKNGIAIPLCLCGKGLHHQFACWARVNERARAAGRATRGLLATESQQDMRRRLLQGEEVRSVATSFGLQSSQLYHHLSTWSLQDRNTRNAALATREEERRAALALKFSSRQAARAVKKARKSVPTVAITPFKDPIYARISAEVPCSIDAALRDDMISEAYLDILEGRLDYAHLEAGMKRVRNRVYAAHASRWGPVSLDALRDDGSGRSLIENVPDGTTAFL